MRAVDILRKKRDGEVLNRDEIEAFVDAATHDSWPEYQLSALLMAIVCRGMTTEETGQLTAAMVASGEKLDLSEIPGLKVDKHSTGGVGDKTSLILAPLAAACGAIVPMMSGRGLGHTGGTLDKLESIPGFQVRLTTAQLRECLKTNGCALIGQTAEIAPADKKLYALRDVTATVESIPLICASIMSKKIAEGISGLVLDVKCGSGAFMKNREAAKELAESLIRIGLSQGVKTQAIITAMEEPLGQAVGNALEVIESIETLKGNGPKDLEELSVELAGRMVHLAGEAESVAEAKNKARDAIASGQGVETFRKIIKQQGGDPKVIDDYSILDHAPRQHLYRAEKNGILQTLDAYKVGVASMILGAGRDKAEDTIDPAVGIRVLAKQGQEVAGDEPLLELHYREEKTLQSALKMLEGAVAIGEEGAPTQWILETLDENS